MVEHFEPDYTEEHMRAAEEQAEKYAELNADYEKTAKELKGVTTRMQETDCIDTLQELAEHKSWLERKLEKLGDEIANMR